MARNKMSDLRNHLFETLEALKDADNPMELDRAHAISDVAQTIINSAKAEIDLLKVIGGGKPCNAFFELQEESRELPRRLLSEVTPKTERSAAQPVTQCAVLTPIQTAK